MANQKRQKSESFKAPTKKEVGEMLNVDPDDLLDGPELETPSEEEINEMLTPGEVIQEKKPTE